MKPLNTFAEARAADCSHILVRCSNCRRVNSLMIDAVERKTRCLTLDELLFVFKCHRCGSRPDQALFMNFGYRMHYFNYVVVVWDEHRVEIDHVEAAAMSLAEATPAFCSVIGRFPKRWVTLQSCNTLLGDSNRREFVFDG